MLTDKLKRVSIAHLPTPIEQLDRLSAQLQGPTILVKRDDLTGLATGGNKTRKLEFLVGEALAGRADALVTGGAAQSNHSRQTAAAAARFGLRPVLVLRGEEPPTRTGNLLLDDLFGAEIHWAGQADLAQAIQQAAEDLWSQGGRPALVPYGGSNVVGASGYVAAMEELSEQLAAAGQKVDTIVLASSSSGTQAGLLVGARALNFDGQVLGISVDKKRDELATMVAELASETAAFLNLDAHFTADEVLVNDDYLGGGYAVISDVERQAIRLFAQTEGLLLDPVYTGRAAAGLVDLIQKGTWNRDQTVLFWHTGGTAGLFGFGDQIVG